MINDLLLKSIQQFPHYEVWVLGHSLGGAVAVLYAIDLKIEKGIHVKVVTYGGPRMGNQAFAEFTNDILAANYFRITHLHDPVPFLPLTSLGYMHLSSEYYQSTWSWNRQDMILCNATDNTPCNPTYPGLINEMVAAHLYYFRTLGECLLPFQEIQA